MSIITEGRLLLKMYSSLGGAKTQRDNPQQSPAHCDASVWLESAMLRIR